jgi:hypothetical protein
LWGVILATFNFLRVSDDPAGGRPTLQIAVSGRAQADVRNARPSFVYRLAGKLSEDYRLIAGRSIAYTLPLTSVYSNAICSVPGRQAGLRTTEPYAV